MSKEQLDEVKKAREGSGISRLIYEVVARFIKIEKYIQAEEARNAKRREHLSRDAKDAKTAMKSMFEDMDTLHSDENANPMATILMAIQKFNDMSKEKMDRVEQFEKDEESVTYDKVVVTDAEVAKLMYEWADKSESDSESIKDTSAVDNKLA